MIHLREMTPGKRQMTITRLMDKGRTVARLMLPQVMIRNSRLMDQGRTVARLMVLQIPVTPGQEQIRIIQVELVAFAAVSMQFWVVEPVHCLVLQNELYRGVRFFKLHLQVLCQ